MEAVSSFAHSETASLLQSAYSDYQIGAFENFDQLVEDALIVLGPRLKVFFQYELRFANRMKSQLLIGHRFSSSTNCHSERKKEKSSHFLGISPFFWDIPSIFVSMWNSRAECGTHQGCRPFRQLICRHTADTRVWWKSAKSKLCPISLVSAEGLEPSTP
jgi:hypothetical protein